MTYKNCNLVCMYTYFTTECGPLQEGLAKMNV